MPRQFTAATFKRLQKQGKIGTGGFKFNKKRKASKPSRPDSTFASKVLAVINRKEETKYVAEDVLPAQAVLSTQTTPANLARILPNMSQGVGDFQRIGDQVVPVRARAMWVVNVNGVNNDFQDITINLLVLRVKGASTAAAVAATPATKLLMAGNGNFVDPDSAVFTQQQMISYVNHYKLNTDQYTKLKHFKRRFANGSYGINGVPGANATSQIAIAQPMHTFTWSWVPPKLKYNGAGDLLPTNHYPVYLIWATTNDGGAYSGRLTYSLRTELFYKDA